MDEEERRNKGKKGEEGRGETRGRGGNEREGVLRYIQYKQ